MNINGILAIKSVRKSQNENGRTVYMGEAVFKDFANFINMPFMLTALSDKAANFYDSYIMQPGKSGYAVGKISVGQNGIYLNLDSMEFGSLKLEGSNNQNQQQNNYNKPQQQRPQEPIIEDNSQGFNFNNFNQNNSTSSETSNGLNNTAGQGFWNNFAKR